MTDSLKAYVEHAQDIMEQAPQMGETNTKEMLIRRFIEMLGWTFHPSEITLEYPVRIASRRTKVDYALLIDGTPTVFVEAKGLDTALANSHREQLTSYMHNEEGVEWGLLTNGAEYEMYRYDDTPSGTRLGALQIGELGQQPHLVRALSKPSVKAGESEQIVRRIREQRQAITTLRSAKDDIASDITQLLTNRIGDTIAATVETEAKELIDRVVASLENGAGPDGDAPTFQVQESRNAVASVIRRSQIEGDADAEVAIFPTRESGVDFLLENNAWGFVRVGRSPAYVGMYVSSPVQEVQFVAEVDRIVPAHEADLARPAESYVEIAHFDPEKQVVLFKPGSLHRLKAPIPFEGRTIQSLRYTDLRRFKRASTTDDLF
jgi:predicted type IV restriction endonuclease